jgi:hypothetical protein
MAKKRVWRYPTAFRRMAVERFNGLRDLGLQSEQTRCDPIRRCRLHYLGVLVHGVHFLRQSCRDGRPIIVRYVCIQF